MRVKVRSFLAVIILKMSQQAMNPVIKASEMDQEMQEFALETARQALILNTTEQVILISGNCLIH